MRRTTTLALALGLVAVAMPAAAQQRPAKTFLSVFAAGYTDAGGLRDAGTVTGQTVNWNLGSGIGAGAALQRQLGQGLMLGVEATYVPSIGVERSTSADSTGATPPRGDGSILTAMATGRIMTGGGGGVGLYLAGGAGIVGYSLPALGNAESTFDTDLAFRTSAGLEYQFNRRTGAFVEWGRFWAFHPSEGVDTQTNKFSQIRGGVRLGW